MRARVYYLAYFLTKLILLVLGATFDGDFSDRWFSPGSGYIWFMMTIPDIFLLSFVATVQIRLYSPKGISDYISTSLGPGAKFAEFPAIRTEDGRVAFPAVEFWALGGGRYGGVNAPDGREYGFAIVRKGLSIMIEGQVFWNAFTHEYAPADRAMWRMLAQINPYQIDERRRLPSAWLEILKRHPRFSALKSPIYLMDVPLFPYIDMQEGDAEPMLHLPGVGDFKLSEVIPEGSPSVILDLRARLDEKMGGELKAKGDAYGEREKELLAVISNLTDMLSMQSDVLARTTEQTTVEKVREAAFGREEGAERKP